MNFTRTIFLFVLMSSSVTFFGSETPPTPTQALLKRSGSLIIPKVSFSDSPDSNSFDSRNSALSLIGSPIKLKSGSSEASPRSVLSSRKNDEMALSSAAGSRAKQTHSGETSPSGSPSRRNLLLVEIKAGLTMLEEMEIDQHPIFINNLQKKLTEYATAAQEEASYKIFLTECKRKAEEKYAKEEAEKRARKEYERATLWYDFPSGSGNKVCTMAELRKEEKEYFKKIKEQSAAILHSDCP